jgi:hypothetical protein
MEAAATLDLGSDSASNFQPPADTDIRSENPSAESLHHLVCVAEECEGGMNAYTTGPSRDLAYLIGEGDNWPALAQTYGWSTAERAGLTWIEWGEARCQSCIASGSKCYRRQLGTSCLRCVGAPRICTLVEEERPMRRALDYGQCESCQAASLTDESLLRCFAINASTPLNAQAPRVVYVDDEEWARTLQ